MSLWTAIEWAVHTLNLWTGCIAVSPGCKNCYARRFAERFRGVSSHPFEFGFDLVMRLGRLELLKNWKPARIFINSMSDTFLEATPESAIEILFDTFREQRQHEYQILTKRSVRMREFIAHYLQNRNLVELPRHIWLGVSVESEKYLWRIRDLQAVPATIRFVSFEPLLGPIRLDDSLLAGIHWVIVGGESGPGARRMQEEWVLSIRDACVKRNIPLFFKQWGQYDESGRSVGKKRAGRLLKGENWSDFPTGD